MWSCERIFYHGNKISLFLLQNIFEFSDVTLPLLFEDVMMVNNPFRHVMYLSDYAASRTISVIFMLSVLNPQMSLSLTIPFYHVLEHCQPT